MHLYMDGYSIAYGVALAGTLIFAALWGGGARAKGAVLLISAWMVTLTATWTLNPVGQLWAFVVLDVIMFGAFWAIANHDHQQWPKLVAALHAIMIWTHTIYVWRELDNSFVYLSILAGLGYVAMMIIGIPPLIGALAGLLQRWLKAGGRTVPERIQRLAGLCHEMDIISYFRGGSLPASAFLGKSKAKRERGP